MKVISNHMWKHKYSIRECGFGVVPVSLCLITILRFRNHKSILAWRWFDSIIQPSTRPTANSISLSLKFVPSFTPCSPASFMLTSSRLPSTERRDRFLRTPSMVSANSVNTNVLICTTLMIEQARAPHHEPQGFCSIYERRQDNNIFIIESTQSHADQFYSSQ